MRHFLLRPSSLYVLFSFFCLVFLLVFYNGYRVIYADANFFHGQNPAAPYSAEVEKAVQKQHDQFMEEVAWFSQRNLSASDQALDQRHKLRWLYKTIEAKVYAALAPLSPRAFLYAKYLHYAAYVLIAFVFMALMAERLRGELRFSELSFLAFAVYAGVALASTVPHMYEQHSFIEMAAVSAGLYFALGRNMLPFLAVLFLAVANRETGAALGVIYALINWRERGFWLPLALGPVFLAAINADLLMLPEFYRIENFVVTGANTPGLLNIFTITRAPVSLIAITLLKTFAFLAPAGVLIPKAIGSEIGRRILGIMAIYLVILVLGTVLGNLFPYVMLIPMMVALWAVGHPAKAAAPPR